MRLFKNILSISLVAALAVACFPNDMSLPRVLAQFTKLEVEGALETTIDPATRTVSLVVNEEVELSMLAVNAVELNEKASFKNGNFPSTLDLTSPMEVMLTMYQDYWWTIKATQPVERYVYCANQIGEAEFDVQNRIAKVYVSQSQRLDRLEVLDMKLERVGSVVTNTTAVELVNTQTGETSEVTRNCEFPMVLNCDVKRTFNVSFQGQDIPWTLYAVPVEVAAEIKGIDARCYYAEVIAAFGGGDNPVPVFEYKQADAQEWTVIPEEDITVDGINISAMIYGLELSTDYSVRIIANDEILPEENFRTGTPMQLYNSTFDEWWQDDKVWYPYAKGASPSVWDSANPGAAKFIGSSTYPTEDIVNADVQDGKVRKAAEMVSRNAAVAFAAGNLYVGKFGKVQGIGAILDWGTEFTEKPMGLKGYYKYSPAIISHAKEPYLDLIGKAKDKCQILVFLTDWDRPFTVNTTAGEFVDLENDKSIIALGKIESDELVNEYKEFYIPLEYRDKTRTPKYIVISCCASYLGDYFTGGEGSKMVVDEFELVYDQPIPEENPEQTE